MTTEMEVRTDDAHPIPNRLIFIWFGETFPVANLVAVRSAMRHCKPEETLLIHEGLTSSTPGVEELMCEPGFRLVDAGPHWFEGLPPGAEEAAALYGELASPATRANLLRLAALFKLGGVYLDTDTITVKDLAPLRCHEGFCGRETLGMPASLFKSRSPFTWTLAGLRLATRAVLSRVPGGAAAFRKVEHLYPQAVNNAVVGSRSQNPILAEAFLTISAMSKATQRRRFRLGTHLMQAVTRNQSSERMEVLAPAYFYPLGPEISLHWFARGSAQRLEQMLCPETYVVHWYSSLQSSVKDGPLDQRYIRKYKEITAFAQLASEYVDR